MTHKVLFVTPYPKDSAPSQRLKFEQYYTHLEECGYEIETSAFVDEKFWTFIYKKGFLPQKIYRTFLGYLRRILLLFKLRKYDVIYIHLWVTPYGLPLFEWLFKSIHKKIIYDIDDMVFLGHSSRANKLFEFLKGKKKMIYLMKNAKHVVTCTPFLDDFVKKYNPNTMDISSTINTLNYSPINTYNNSSQLVLGWSGSHSTSKYLYLIQDELIKIKEKLDFKLLVMGDSTFHIKGLDIEAIEWNEQFEIETLQRMDIGLYPLPNEQWVLGKSGLKALQYMALGIPTVATAIGANYRVIDHNESGFLVNNSHEWIEAITKYLTDSELRKKHGQKGRTKVETHYSVLANKDKYIQIIHEVATKS